MTSERKGRELNSEIDRLQTLLDQKKMEQKILQENCKHKWLDPIYDPEEVDKFVFTHYEWRGVDPFPQGYYRKELKPRWSKECESCGLKKYTYKQEPVITRYVPTFDRD